MTKQEALFRAIGQLEESQLAQSEHTMLNLSHAQEDKNMDNKKCKRRILPNILVAILIVTMLATTAFAAVGYLLFDTPIQMIQALFGNETGYDAVNWSVEGNSGETYAYSADRAPVDESVARENLEPVVEPVGQSITYAGHTLTVDANGYDAATKCGFVTYTIENPDGLRQYQVQANGEVWFPLGELLTTNQYGRSYILKDKSTDTKLCATYYYQIQNPQTEDLELRLSFWTAIEDPEAFMALPPEEAVQMNVSDSEDAIVISTANSASLETATFGNGAVTVSAIALQVDLSLVGDRDFVDTLKILFRDETEYIIQGDGIINSLFNVGSSDGSEVTFMMNRLVDVDQIASVIVNESGVSPGTSSLSGYPLDIQASQLMPSLFWGSAPNPRWKVKTQRLMDCVSISRYFYWYFETDLSTRAKSSGDGFGLLREPSGACLYSRFRVSSGTRLMWGSSWAFSSR